MRVHLDKDDLLLAIEVLRESAANATSPYLSEKYTSAADRLEAVMEHAKAFQSAARAGTRNRGFIKNGN